MSDLIASPTLPQKMPVAGIMALVTAAGLAVIYFWAPYMHDGWPAEFYPLFWVFEAGLTIFGVIGLAWKKLPAAWTHRLPTLSRNRVFIPREGVGYLLIMVVLFVGSSLTQSNTLLLVFAAMAGPFVVNGWITYTMLKNVRVARRPPQRAMVGELFSVGVDLANEAPLVSMWMMVAQDQVAFESAQWQPTILFTRVPAKSVQSGHYQIRLMQRGRHHFGPIQIMSRFPLGLIERGCLFRELDEVLIYPRIGRLSPKWKRRLIGASELIETPQPRLGVFNDEFHHLREYRAGDNPRAIHWRSSARRNALIVREFQQNREHHLFLLIDLWRAPGGADAARQIEQTLSVAATICWEHRRECRGATLTVQFCGVDQWRWEARANSSGLETLLDHLAVADSSRVNGFAKALVESMGQVSPHTRVVVVSTRAEADVRNEWDAQLQSTARPAAVQWLQVDDARYAELIVIAERENDAPPTTRVEIPAATAAS